jgi:hypothetical protein
MKATQEALAVLPAIRKIEAAGVTSASGIAKALNDQGITPPRGGQWQVVQVQRVLARVAPKRPRRGRLEVAWSLGPKPPCPNNLHGGSRCRRFEAALGQPPKATLRDRVNQCLGDVSGLEKGLDVLLRNVLPPPQPCDPEEGFELLRGERLLQIACHEDHPRNVPPHQAGASSYPNGVPASTTLGAPVSAIPFPSRVSTGGLRRREGRLRMATSIMSGAAATLHNPPAYRLIRHAASPEARSARRSFWNSGREPAILASRGV